MANEFIDVCTESILFENYYISSRIPLDFQSLSVHVTRVPLKHDGKRNRERSCRFLRTSYVEGWSIGSAVITEAVGGLTN